VKLRGPLPRIPVHPRFDYHRVPALPLRSVTREHRKAKPYFLNVFALRERAWAQNLLTIIGAPRTTDCSGYVLDVSHGHRTRMAVGSCDGKRKPPKALNRNCGSKHLSSTL